MEGKKFWCKQQQGERRHFEMHLYLLNVDSSVSNTIRNRIPTETWVKCTAFLYFESGMMNSAGLVLTKNKIKWLDFTKILAKQDHINASNKDNTQTLDYRILGIGC